MLSIISFLRPHFSKLFLSFAIIVCFVCAGWAQSALDGFDPNANGTIRTIAIQADGKILIGGDFTTLAPNEGAAVTRNHIARLNPNGTVDLPFNPNANGSVDVITVQADGKILVGGAFNQGTGTPTIGGQVRNYIARLEPVSGTADAFNPNANLDVLAIAVQADGKVLAGGEFFSISGANSIGGQPRNYIARLDATTGAADSWDPNANNVVRAVVVQADGKILAGGDFSFGTIGGQTRNFIARLDATTGLADSFNPAADSTVRAIAVEADGKILAGGVFTNIGGQARNRIARLDAATGAADSFNPNSNNIIECMAVQADGKILVGGRFFGAASIGGQTRTRIARLDPITGAADSFDPNANNFVLAISVQQNGKVLAAGIFTTLAPDGGAAVTRNGIARLETDGRLDRTLDLQMQADSLIYTSVVQPDGKILIGGSFGVVLGVSRQFIARLNTDGTLDTAFNPNANANVYAIALQTDGKILVGGEFNGANSIGGQTRNYIARLDAATGAADAFNPNANNYINSIAVQADGKILVGGTFTIIGGAARNHITRLDTTGFADSFDPNASGGDIETIAVETSGKILMGGGFTSIGGQARIGIARVDPTSGLADPFSPNANAPVSAIVLQADGKILAGGFFTTIGGQTRNRIARLDASTGLPDSFDPNADVGVFSIALQTDGKILIGGGFTNIGGQTRNGVARLDAATGLPDSFDPSPNRTAVTSIAVQADGKILVGGFFTAVGGQARPAFARLANDTVATQNLAVTQTAVTWTRGGSSPQFARVTFEASTDGVNYTLLGNGTETGSNWNLTGLSLPTGQSVYIRARGYIRTGYQNGSESIMESVRNAFLTAGPAITGTVTYGNAIGNPPAPRFVSNVLISGAGSVPVSVLTGGLGATAGQYSLTGFGAGAYTVTPTKTGGVNGSITSFDAAKISQHVAGTVLLTGNQLLVADVSGNGQITSFDAAQIAQFVAGTGSGMQTGTWKFVPVNKAYSSITANITGEDYSALLMGEVSGNWTNTGARLVGSGRSSSGGPEKTTAISAPSLVTPVDNEVTIPISAEGMANKGIISYEFDLRYDPSVIQPQADPVDLAGTVSSKLSALSNSEEPGLLRVVVYGPMPIDGSGVLLNLRFTAIGAPGSASPLTWEHLMLNEGSPRITAIDGQIELSAASGQS